LVGFASAKMTSHPFEVKFSKQFIKDLVDSSGAEIFQVYDNVHIEEVAGHKNLKINVLNHKGSFKLDQIFDTQKNTITFKYDDNGLDNPWIQV
jgi:hypothetical protein